MPLVANPGQGATNLVGEAVAELARPLPHGFVADHDAARGQQLLHHAQPERKAEIQPHGMADDLGWKPMALVAGASGGRHSTRLSAPVSQRNPEGHVKLTVPFADNCRAQLVGGSLQCVEGKRFRLADEVRYIQRRAADYDSRTVTIGQLILFSTKTGDAWLLDHADQLAARLARKRESEPIQIDETDTTCAIEWNGR